MTEDVSKIVIEEEASEEKKKPVEIELDESLVDLMYAHSFVVEAQSKIGSGFDSLWVMALMISQQKEESIKEALFFEVLRSLYTGMTEELQKVTSLFVRALTKKGNRKKMNVPDVFLDESLWKKE